MNAIAPEPLSGLEQLRAVFDASHPDRAPGIGKTLGFSVVELEEGRVVFGGQPDESVYNPIGTVHGGYAATLLDSAMGCAVHSTLKAGEGYTTLELKVAFHKTITRDTGELRIEGRVLARGSRVGSAEGRIRDMKGELLASGTTTCLIF